MINTQTDAEKKNGALTKRQMLFAHRKSKGLNSCGRPKCFCPALIHYSNEALNGHKDAQVSLLEPLLTALLCFFTSSTSCQLSV